MASPRQVAANRRNASLPRGPLSPEASAAISQNANKHGLTAKHIVLKHEDYAAYQELQASIVMEYRPCTPQEHRYADQIAQNYWRLLRCRRVETAAFENRLASLKDRLEVDPHDQSQDDEALSICMAIHSRDFDVLRRYETSIERAWHRSIRELRIAQKERRANEAAEAREEADEEGNRFTPLADTLAERRFAVSVSTNPNRTNEPNLSEIGIGCVSQNDSPAFANASIGATPTPAGPSGTEPGAHAPLR
ncbi:MAG: hypothetical protein ABJF23_32605 [Bryobacteraceae bacterium]